MEPQSMVTYKIHSLMGRTVVNPYKISQLSQKEHLTVDFEDKKWTELTMETR